MKPRKALLFRDFRKDGDHVETVTVLHIGTVGNDDGSYIAASVAKLNGDVVEVGHDRLRFIE